MKEFNPIILILACTMITAFYFIDFNNRFVGLLDNNSFKPFNIEEKELIFKSHMLNSETVKLLKNSYKNPTSTIKSVNSIDNKRVTEDNTTSLKTLNGEHKILLQGIVKKNNLAGIQKIYFLIQLINESVDEENKVIKLLDGESIFDYRASILSNTSIQLVNSNTKHVILLKMYKGVGQ
ncbi:hypothetical protein [Flocculibacter collagenilyticus]|uniref:hypothetical protein n=1 Tax=Flocculibacter collagenilyticus TaxID=2744479 RepID=UPI0018F764B8|nr:hypothetical protein [Flocculibacter collagenilyticus]